MKNNTVERLHGTIKKRTKILREMETDGSAKLPEGQKLHYNYLRQHTGLKEKTLRDGRNRPETQVQQVGVASREAL
jgi:hypothetical protein